LSAFEVQNLQQLHLGQNDVVRQTLDQSLAQSTLTLAEQMSLGVQRPRAGSRAISGSELLG